MNAALRMLKMSLIPSKQHFKRLLSFYASTKLTEERWLDFLWLINTWARQQDPDAEAILSNKKEHQPSTQLIALSKAMWMYARPRFQGGTQSQHRCPSQGMGGKAPQVFFWIRWIKASLAFTHTQIFCQGWNACGDHALHSKKDYLLTIF